MNITPINNTNFYGNLRTTGGWPQDIQESFLNSKGVNEYAQKSKYDIVGKLKNKRGRYNEDLYKIIVQKQDPNKSMLSGIKNAFFGVFGKSLTRHYHSSSGMERILGLISANYMNKRFRF